MEQKEKKGTESEKDGLSDREWLILEEVGKSSGEIELQNPLWNLKSKRKFFFLNLPSNF